MKKIYLNKFENLLSSNSDNGFMMIEDADSRLLREFLDNDEFLMEIDRMLFEAFKEPFK